MRCLCWRGWRRCTVGLRCCLRGMGSEIRLRSKFAQQTAALEGKAIGDGEVVGGKELR